MSILPSSKGKTQGEDTTSDKSNKHGVKWCMDKKNVRPGEGMGSAEIWHGRGPGRDEMRGRSA